MEIFRPKEEIDSINLQNVENLTNNMKTACPTLDNIEVNSYVESTADHLKDIDDKENQDASNESSFDRISRRPVESWKYKLLKAENNRTSYKCSLCSSIYQHKKSLNKHWKDKHPLGSSSTCNTIPQEGLCNNLVVNAQIPYAHSNVMYPNGSNAVSYAVKNEPIITKVFYNVEDNDLTGVKVQRKRSSLQLDNNENIKENFLCLPQKRLSLVQPLSVNNMSVILRPNNAFKFVNNGTNNSFNMPVVSESAENILDLRKPHHGALDLRTAKSRVCYRCFQCTFRSSTVFELNDHFKLAHMSTLVGAKSYQIPVKLYHKLLINQFNAIVRTECESMETFNCRMNCCLCGFVCFTRFEMIQHIGVMHEMEMVWICLVCGFGCSHPMQLKDHFETHSDIQLLSKPSSTGPWPNPQMNVTNSCNSSNSNLNLSHNEKFIPPDFENNLATSTPISANKCKRITSKKEPSIIDSFNCKEKTLKCLVCDATARWRSELFTHMITHSEHRSFGCKFCSYRSKWKWDVPKHLKRCRLAPAYVRKPDVQNSYLITLLQHYSPPPGDILYQFMKEYNIKDIGSLNKTGGLKNGIEDEFPSTEQSSSYIEGEVKSDIKNAEIDSKCEAKYESISDVTDELDVDVGTDVITGLKENFSNSDTVLRYTFKRCPWCQAFLTDKPSEMSNHLAQYHGDVDTGIV